MAIVPDTKDWTWVLDRGCPECGFDSTTVDGRDIPPLIRGWAGAWREVLKDPNVALRPSTDRWSPLEYACHVRDVLRIGDARLQLMLIQRHPTFPNWDQDDTALDDDYGSQNTDAVAAELDTSAARFASDLEALSARGWARTGQRNDGTDFSAETFARYVAHDAVHHLSDVGVRPD
jgi:hypothetical protein